MPILSTLLWQNSKILKQLMQLCDELQQSKEQKERLLQRVLREALQPKTKEIEIN
jgi:hypothetical protein